MARYPEHEYAYGALDYNPCLHAMRVQMTYHTYTSPTPATSSWAHVFDVAPLRYAPRRQPTHPSSTDLAGAQGVLGRFGTWYLRVFPVVIQHIHSYEHDPHTFAAYHASSRHRSVEPAGVRRGVVMRYLCIPRRFDGDYDR